MASPSRTAEREEERRHNLRTLAAASTGSAAAALLTSQLWIAGTWIAAAVTPVIVALVSELMNRPAERIARTFTTDRAALRHADREALPEAGGAAPPARPEADPLPKRAAPEPAPVRVYRAGGSAPGPITRRRKIAYGAVFGTAALAFVIAVLALTVPELLAGGSVGKNDGRTTFFGGKNDGNGDRGKQAPQDTTQDEQPQPEEEEQQQTTPQQEPEQTTPSETEEEAPPPEETAPPGEPLPQDLPPAEQPQG